MTCFAGGGGSSGNASISLGVTEDITWNWVAEGDNDSPGLWYVESSVSGNLSASALVGGEMQICLPNATASSASGTVTRAYADKDTPSNSQSRSWSGKSDVMYQDQLTITRGASASAEANASYSAPYVWHYDYGHPNADGSFPVIVDHSSNASANMTASGKIDYIGPPTQVAPTPVDMNGGNPCGC